MKQQNFIDYQTILLVSKPIYKLPWVYIKYHWLFYIYVVAVFGKKNRDRWRTEPIVSPFPFVILCKIHYAHWTSKMRLFLGTIFSCPLLLLWKPCPSKLFLIAPCRVYSPQAKCFGNFCLQLKNLNIMYNNSVA